VLVLSRCWVHSYTTLLTAMVVSGALVWCHRDGKLQPLRLDCIRLSGDLTQAHWSAVTQFLDLVTSQRLVIHDEGMSVQSISHSTVPDDGAECSGNFSNLIKDQKCAKKYSLSDSDGVREAGGSGTAVQRAEAQC